MPWGERVAYVRDPDGNRIPRALSHGRLITNTAALEQNSAMMRTATLTIADGVRVVVPDSIGLITPYVLFEQQDWFEDEIKFLRRLLRPYLTLPHPLV